MLQLEGPKGLVKDGYEGIVVQFQTTEWLIVIELKVTKDSIVTILLPLVYMKVFFEGDSE